MSVIRESRYGSGEGRGGEISGNEGLGTGVGLASRGREIIWFSGGGEIMGIPGRKTTPTHLKILRGNPGKRPINENEPKFAPIAPEPPSWLPSEAKKLWKDLAPKMASLGLLTEADGPAFAMMLMHYVMACRAAKTLARDGITTKDDEHVNADGTPSERKHPAHQIFRDNSAAFRQWCAEFGLTPASRSRLSLPEPDEDDEFEAFIDGPNSSR